MILVGDNLPHLRAMADNSVDAIVTDPPYGLSFMGKKWDYDVPSVELWAECLRVLKPGGHLLAFAGTRTQHRMACRIEDAGFELRDMIAWLYGSGFPKSLDVAKAIDKAGGDALAWRAFSEAYAAAVSSSPMTHADIDRSLGIKSSSCYWARTDHRGGMPPRHHWDRVRDLLGLPAEFALLYDEAEREVVGHRERGLSPGTNAVYGTYSGDTRITAPATEAARQWEGWGTALKPAMEPITVARKPLAGTVAANVLAHGTGALNIDGCRVGSEAQRWPANVIHDGSDEVLSAFPQAPGQLAKAKSDGSAMGNAVYGAMRHGTKQPEPRSDAGSAARFFYCAKASRADRNEGLPNPGQQFQHGATLRQGESAATTGNNHPTVKPTALMRYLCRLVTPPGGLVLDPFVGSGSTGKAAALEGFRFIGIEQDPAFAEIARTREAHAIAAYLDGGVT